MERCNLFIRIGAGRVLAARELCTRNGAAHSSIGDGTGVQGSPASLMRDRPAQSLELGALVDRDGHPIVRRWPSSRSGQDSLLAYRPTDGRARA